MAGGIFLTVKDLMKITGSNNYNSCANLHRAIRDTISKRKKSSRSRNTVNTRRLILLMCGTFYERFKHKTTQKYLKQSITKYKYILTK